MEVHGITDEFLRDKPRFGDVVDEFLEFIRGAELVIHNAAFDIGFINAELQMLGRDLPAVESICRVTDTLAMARQRHPGQRNNLDALCQRYGVDNSHRELHGALLDAEILADVYLALTGGQTALALAGEDGGAQDGGQSGYQIRRLPADRLPLRVIRASAAELAAHEQRLQEIDKASGGATLFRKLETDEIANA